MPYYLKYEYDDFESGYIRVGVPHNSNYIQASNSGRVIAHDYIEHPKGYPTGTLEDEIAAFGVVIATRMQAGLIGGFLGSPDQMIATELKEMIDCYRDGIEPANQLKARRSYYRSYVPGMDDIAENISPNRILQKRLVAWFEYGVTVCRRRFNQEWKALELFQQIEKVVNDLTQYHTPYQFTLRINGSRVTLHEPSLIY